MTNCPKCGAPVADGVEHCTECGLRIEGATQSFAPVGSGEPDAPMVGEPTDGPALIVRKGPEVGDSFFIDRETLTVGRDPDSDIFLNDVTVSRSHAVITRVGDVVTVEDSGSLNGTFVNGKCVAKADLGPGDSVQFGTFQMVFLTGGEIA